MPSSVEDLGDRELASSSLWLPSNLASAQPSPSPPTSASHSSRPLRPGDWRTWAAVETGGAPVRPPVLEFENVPTENTPNIDDCHSPASTATNTGGSPAFHSRSSTPAGFSPLRPRVLPTGSARTGTGPGRDRRSYDTTTNTPHTVASQGCIPAAPSSAPPASVESPRTEASFACDSPARSHAATPLLGSAAPSPVRVLTAAGSDGELSSPGSDSPGYCSPKTEGPAPLDSSLRSSIHMNALFMEGSSPGPEVDSGRVAKALALSPCAASKQGTRTTPRAFGSDWSSPVSSDVQQVSLSHGCAHSAQAASVSAAEASRGRPMAVAAHAADPPPSPMLDLETPRRSIRSLSQLLGRASGATSGVSAASLAHGKRGGGGTKDAAASSATPPPQGARAQPPRPSAQHAAPPPDATPCSANIPRDAAVRQDAADDTRGRAHREPDQTPRKSDKRASSPKKEREAGAAQQQETAAPPAASSPAQHSTRQAAALCTTQDVPDAAAATSAAAAAAAASRGVQQQRRAEKQPMRALGRAASWLLLVAALGLATFCVTPELPRASAPAAPQARAEPPFSLQRLGPVCFVERFPMFAQQPARATRARHVAGAATKADPPSASDGVAPDPAPHVQQEPPAPLPDELALEQPAPAQPEVDVAAEHVVPTSPELSALHTDQAPAAISAEEHVASDLVAPAVPDEAASAVAGPEQSAPALQEELQQSAAAADHAADVGDVDVVNTEAAQEGAEPQLLEAAAVLAAGAAAGAEPAADSARISVVEDGGEQDQQPAADASAAVSRELRTESADAVHSCPDCSAAAAAAADVAVDESHAAAMDAAHEDADVATTGAQPDGGQGAAAAEPVQASGPEERPAAPAASDVSPSMRSAKRSFTFCGWTLAQLCIGVLAACSLGALLALAAERMPAHVELSWPARVQASAPATPAKASTNMRTGGVVRILRLKKNGHIGTPGGEHAAAVPMSPRPTAGAEPYEWVDGKLVYHEVALTPLV